MKLNLRNYEKLENERNERGITLVALIITIIILLILAGVTISTLSNSGLFSKTQEAVERSKQAQEEEEEILEQFEEELSKYPGSENVKIEVLKKGETIAKRKETQGNTVTAFSVTKKTTIKDTLGNEVIIPAGFGIATDSADNVEGGIVIEDLSHSNTAGSQFVWVPVGNIKTSSGTKTITLGRYSFDTNTGAYSTYTGTFKEDDGTYSNTRAKDISGFKTSVSTNGGYYIARYEAGIKGMEASTEDANYNGKTKNSDSNFQIVTKANVGVWNKIRQPYAATVSRNMYTSGSGVESDLINSYAWDTAIVFIQECGTKENSSAYSIQSGQSKTSTIATTGTNLLKYDINKTELSTGIIDEQCNIYDMAGNVREWSTETTYDSNLPCAGRGGLYGYSDYYTGNRGFSNTSYPYSDVGFRPHLYL